MSGASPLALFRVRNFRYQWPADLTTSWAFEMETLILGWYVMVETKSVLMLTAFASLQYIGTLLAPIFGMLGDRLGHRNVACALRLFYATLAATMMSLAFSGMLTPVHVFVLAALMGCVRPSDQVTRYALIGAAMPARQLTQAVGLARTTQDTARIFGALAGAGMMAAMGMAAAYAMIASFYATSLLLTLRITDVRAPAPRQPGPAAAQASSLRALAEAARHVRDTPHLRAVLCLALLLNFTAFPLVNGLMPYVARELFQTNQAGLGFLVAGFAVGGLTGSLLLSRFGGAVRPGRTMLVFCCAWYLTILAFARVPDLASGIPVLVLAGCAQSLGMASMSSLLVRTAGDRLRGRIMGLRMLAIYGLPMGLLLSGPLIARFGYPATATLYCGVGLTIALTIAVRWRAWLWRIDAPANAR